MHWVHSFTHRRRARVIAHDSPVGLEVIGCSHLGVCAGYAG